MILYENYIKEQEQEGSIGIAEKKSVNKTEQFERERMKEKQSFRRQRLQK